jgi:hypothetical protein
VIGSDTWLEGGLSGTARAGGLTEAQLTDELGPELARLPIPRSASATISWWQLRQQAFKRAVAVRGVFRVFPEFLFWNDSPTYFITLHACMHARAW